MTERTNSLRERYSALSDDELQNVAIKQQALQRKEKSIHLYSRIGYGISLFGILAGLFALYVQKDERNGVGMIIASAILFPLVWVIAMLRRLVWRFLLRP
ncbi:MAG: hypothetical protein WA715_01125 [Candidatus Acidiferrum sp.]